MTDSQPPAAARDAARSEARRMIAGLMPGQTGINLADEVADAVLGAVWPHLQPVDKAECTVCHRTYRTRADGHVRAHSAPRSIHRCGGSPTEEAELAIHPAVGTCTVCDREYHLTKTGKVWVHNNPTLDTTSGSYGLRCAGAGKPAKEQP